jgi:hypothetical protein
MMTSALLDKKRYIAAMLSAKAKDPSINYRKIKADRSIVLLYNPNTKDGKFSSKLNARAELANGYYEAFPHIRYADTLQKNIENLNTYGWPDYPEI